MLPLREAWLGMEAVVGLDGNTKKSGYLTFAQTNSWILFNSLKIGRTFTILILYLVCPMY